MSTADRLVWRTSSHTNAGNACVEVAPTVGGGVLVRDTKDHGNGPVLSFTREQWAAFLARPAVTVSDAVTRHDGVDVATRWHVRDALHFTDTEWDAFLAGARDGEFTFHGEPELAARPAARERLGLELHQTAPQWAARDPGRPANTIVCRLRLTASATRATPTAP